MNTPDFFSAAPSDAATDGEHALDANVPASSEVQATTGGRADERAPSKPLPEDALIILPVRNLVLFPGVVLPITIGRAKSRTAAQEAARLQRPPALAFALRSELPDPRQDDTTRRSGERATWGGQP